MLINLDDELDAILANGKEKAAEDIMQAIKSTYALDAKTIELISISVSAAMRCSHCLKIHIRSASNLGVPDDQIAAAVFLAGNIVNASVLATASRQLDEEREVCRICEISSKACDIEVSRV